MSFNVSEGSTFTPPQPGTFPALCCSLIDLGTQTTVYEGKSTTAKKILIGFEIADPDNRRDDGTAHIVRKRFTASLHPKAALRPFLEGWRGRPFTPEELQRFDLKSILGQPCLVSLVQQEKAGKSFTNVQGAVRLPRGFAAPVGTVPLVSFDLDAPDWDVFAGFHERLRDQIALSPEYQRHAAPAAAPAAPPTHQSQRAAPLAPPAPANAPTARPAPPAPPAPYAEFGEDDDIPF